MIGPGLRKGYHQRLKVCPERLSTLPNPHLPGLHTTQARLPRHLEAPVRAI